MDPTIYKALDQISPHAKEILVKRGSKITKLFDPSQLEHEAPEDLAKGGKVAPVSPALALPSQYGNAPILYSDVSLKKLALNDTSIYDNKKSVRADYNKVCKRSTYYIYTQKCNLVVPKELPED